VEEEAALLEGMGLKEKEHTAYNPLPVEQATQHETPALKIPT